MAMGLHSGAFLSQPCRPPWVTEKTLLQDCVARRTRKADVTNVKNRALMYAHSSPRGPSQARAPHLFHNKGALRVAFLSQSRDISILRGREMLPINCYLSLLRPQFIRSTASACRQCTEDGGVLSLCMWLLRLITR